MAWLIYCFRMKIPAQLVYSLKVGNRQEESALQKLTKSSKYRNDPKFSDRQVSANSADPDQTAPRGAV